MLLSVIALASIQFVPADPFALDKLRARWTEAMEATRVPGLVAVAIKDGKIAFIECLGVRRPGRPDPIDPDTYFYIASITKTYVASVTQILAAEGKLAITDPIVKHEPRFELADPAASASITIEDLLCHRPGLQFGPIVFRDAYSGQIDDSIYFDLLSYVRPAAAPDYSNVNFTVLGRMLETVAADGRYGQWRDVLKERLFDPLGMTRTTGYASIAWGDANAAFPTEGTTMGSVVLPHKSDRTMQAAGGLCSTANDAAKYLLFHLGEGALGDVRLMPREFAVDMRKQRTDVPQEKSPYFKDDGFGLGWQVGTYRGEVLCGHGGGYAGASAYFAFLPERGLAAAVMINRASTSTMALAFTDMMDTLLGREPDPAMLDEVRRIGQNARWATVSEPATNPVTEDGALSLAPETYVGSYADDQHGVIDVRYDGTKLTLALGDLACELDSAGKDAFRALRGPLDTYTGHFELADDGKSVEYVVFRIDDGETPIWFERQ